MATISILDTSFKWINWDYIHISQGPISYMKSTLYERVVLSVSPQSTISCSTGENSFHHQLVHLDRNFVFLCCELWYSSSAVVVRSTGAFKKLSSHPARPALGWEARVECPVPSHYTCQADQSGYRESVSWLSTVLRKRRKIEVPPTWCSMLGGVKDTTQGVKV